MPDDSFSIADSSEHDKSSQDGSPTKILESTKLEDAMLNAFGEENLHSISAISNESDYSNCFSEQFPSSNGEALEDERQPSLFETGTSNLTYQQAENFCEFLERKKSIPSCSSPDTRRLSLYKQFDPLLVSIAEANESKQPVDDVCNKDSNRAETCDQQYRSNLRMSLGLRPIQLKKEFSILVHLPRSYTESELRREIKMRELLASETYIKLQMETDMKVSKRVVELQNLQAKNENLIKEMVAAIGVESQKQHALQKQIQNFQASNDELTYELDTLMQAFEKKSDLLGVFQKSFNLNKALLAECKDNQIELEHELKTKTRKIEESEFLWNKILGGQGKFSKVRAEAQSTQKSHLSISEVLKIQIQKVEMRESSLQKEYETAKHENQKLNVIYENLLGKIN